MYNVLKRGAIRMSEEMPPIVVENLINIFLEDGRNGLVEELCIFENKPKLNNIMYEMVDLMVLVFTGQMQPGAFAQQMELLNNHFYNEICDTALDDFNEGKLTGDQVTRNLNKLQETKARLDKMEKENS